MVDRAAFHINQLLSYVAEADAGKMTSVCTSYLIFDNAAISPAARNAD
jgi:hypothetical protein